MQINTSDLGAGVAALGELIGVLTPGDDPSVVNFNTAWFDNPLASVEQIGTRLDSLVAAIDVILGPADSDGPAVFNNASWYSIPNPAFSTPSGLWIVTSPATDSSGEVGLGTYTVLSSGGVTVILSLYLPLFSYDSSGAQFLPGGTSNPVQLTLSVNSPTSFSIDGVTFSALIASSQIYLADQTPTFSLQFAGLTGTNLPSTYTSLSALLDPTVESWIAEVLTEASGWLNYFTPSPNFTYGDILEAANFVSRNYLFVASNFTEDGLAPLVEQLSSSSTDAISAALWAQFAATDQAVLQNSQSTPGEQIAALTDAFNQIIQNGTSIYNPNAFAGIELSPRTIQLISENPSGASLVKLNRLVLQDLYPTSIVSNPYDLNLQNLQGDASTIALNFVFATLNALATGQVTLVDLPGGGDISITTESGNDGSVTYGLRLTADLPISSGDPSTNGASTPTINFALGTLLSGDTSSNNWLTRSATGTSLYTLPGVSLFGLNRTSAGVLSFAPGFVLGSVGFDVSGSNGQPLINIDGFTLSGFELRFYLNSDGWSYGVAAKLDGVGVPLGQSFNSAVSGAGSDPVAQSLLEAGSGDSGNTPPNPVNPAFSLAGGYVSGGQFVAQLYDSNDAPASVVTIPVQRAFGPLLCQSLGIGWVQDLTNPKNDQLSFLFNGTVELGPMEIDLVGLSIGIPVVTPTDLSSYQLDLQGLGLTLEAGAVELSAALVKLGPSSTASPPRTYTEYNGEALLKAGTFMVDAIGSYARVTTPSESSGFTSLFVFGVFDGELGGPECFFITGLAAGFGYNRGLVLPDMNGVATYPLVVAANDPTKLGGTPPDPAKALQGLDALVPPDQGEYWLAAGLRFTSFDLINSTALVTVEFGNELEIGLLGVSWISLPPPAVPGASAPPEIYAYAELGIEIEVLPSQGEFTASAILTPNSFVIDPACHLTGGFAFYVWFGDNPHAGQFVLTLGGYHPAFQVPSYYPQVPRLGFNWVLPFNVTIQGDAYFALTPSAVMAGGGLQVLYAKGNLKAWFTAEMDALIQWAPLHYDLYIGVSLGASYRASLFGIHKTFSVSLSASVNLWGPKMGGRVHVHWFIISFTVRFGADENGTPEPLDWTNDDGTGFAQTLLPHDTSSSGGSDVLTRTMTAGAAAASATVTPGGLYSITVNNGLLKTFTDSNNNTVWVVSGGQFVFSMTSVIPCTEIQITPAPTEPSGTSTTISSSDYTVYFRPTNTVLSASMLTLTLFSDSENANYDLAGDFDYSEALQSVPAAKYGQPLTSGQNPEMNELLPGRLMGLSGITPKAPTLTPNGADTLEIDIETAFTYDVVDTGDTNYLPLNTTPPFTELSPQPDDDSIDLIGKTLMDSDVVGQRTAVFQALQIYGVNPQTNDSVTTFAANPGDYLYGSPLVSGSSVGSPAAAASSL